MLTLCVRSWGECRVAVVSQWPSHVALSFAWVGSILNRSYLFLPGRLIFPLHKQLMSQASWGSGLGFPASRKGHSDCGNRLCGAIQDTAWCCRCCRCCALTRCVCSGCQQGHLGSVKNCLRWLEGVLAAAFPCLPPALHQPVVLPSHCTPRRKLLAPLLLLQRLMSHHSDVNL